MRVSEGVALQGKVPYPRTAEVDVMKRRAVSKYKSAKKFRKDVGKTSVKNVAQPGRGGFRL